MLCLLKRLGAATAAAAAEVLALAAALVAAALVAAALVAAVVLSAALVVAALAAELAAALRQLRPPLLLLLTLPHSPRCPCARVMRVACPFTTARFAHRCAQRAPCGS